MNEYKKIVYFLKDEGEIVYVGMSLQGIGRPFNHKDKHYTDIDIYDLSELTDEGVAFEEERMIVKHNPKYNKTLSQTGYISFDNIKQRLRNKNVHHSLHHKTNLRKIVKSLDIEFTIFNDREYLENTLAYDVMGIVMEKNSELRNRGGSN